MLIYCRFNHTQLYVSTFFIKNAAMMESGKSIKHFNQHKQIEEFTLDWLPEGNITVGITAGASCPNNLIEETIRRLFELKAIPLENAFPKEAIGLSHQ